MKLLDGRELAGYIKQRHAQQVRRLAGANVVPRLAIVQVKDDPVINTYVRLKKRYGSDIKVVVEVHRPEQSGAVSLIKSLNEDSRVHGIIVQLPLNDPEQTEEVINVVTASKDVDGLSVKPDFTPATPMAILWLLSAYAVELKERKVLIIGRGKLVGRPLEAMLKTSGVQVESATRTTKNLTRLSNSADVIIAAANQAGVLGADMIKPGAVVVDAGVATEQGETKGNVRSEVYERQDITITPQKGGVGPLTVCALFENLLLAAERSRGESR